MNHLVLVAYPVVNSFTMGLASAYAEQLQLLGHDQHTVDLYRVGFSSVVNDNIGNDPKTSSQAASNELNTIRQSDVLTLLYPLWWLSMPALMKGYINRVFKRGYAYDSKNGAVHDGLIFGKKAVLITVSGPSLSSLVENGRWNALQTRQNTDVLHSAGFELIEHLHFSGITPNLSPELSEEYTDRVRDFACQHFPNH